MAMGGTLTVESMLGQGATFASGCRWLPPILRPPGQPARWGFLVFRDRTWPPFGFTGAANRTKRVSAGPPGDTQDELTHSG